MTFEDMLASWLPTQRWYAGQDRPIRDLEITADLMLAAGDPELRHLIITASQGRGIARYQVLVGFRSRLPASLGHAVIGPAAAGTTAYDALHDPALASILLRGIAEQHAVGPLRFGREPGASIDTSPGSRVLGTEQSNTSIVFGDFAILKMLRRLFPGQNPDLEVARALSRLGSARVAAPLGWIETQMDDEPTLLAVLSSYLPHASDGWSLALSSLRCLYDMPGARGRGCVAVQEARAPSGRSHDGQRSGGHSRSPLPPSRRARSRRAGEVIRTTEANPHFTDEAYLLGQATAEIHTDLAAAFGTGKLAPGDLAELADRMASSLEQAMAEVPELARHQAKLRAAYAGLREITGPVTVQRVHGDYHLGQVLRTQTGWVALDFEGEPAIPLAQRTAMHPALKDVAGMLRSFDYAARYPLLDHPDRRRLRGIADAWVQRCQAAFLAGYTRTGEMDPLADAALLRALMLEKTVYEVVYESRHRPAWLSIPLESIAVA